MRENTLFTHTIMFYPYWTFVSIVMYPVTIGLFALAIHHSIVRYY